jgi:hypothetical protein
MSQALSITATVPAYPLGEPYDGRPRYGMTPAQAEVYRWLVQHKPHHDAFGVNFRELAFRMASHLETSHACVRALVERGWLEVAEYRPSATVYRFVHPVRQFKAPRHAQGVHGQDQAGGMGSVRRPLRGVPGAHHRAPRV